MSNYEYKIIPAPRKAQKVKGIRGNSGRFAHNLTEMINEQASDGWEYFRAESLPVDEKTGLFGKTQEVYVSILVFRRPIIVAEFEFHEEETEVEYVEPEVEDEASFEPEIEEEVEPEHVPVMHPSHEEETVHESASLGPVTRD